MTATVGLGGFFTRMRQSLAPDNRSDAELLGDYDATHNEVAFTELVRRFAPMVWGVCRRTVGHHQLAEDAFQAVFLVLIRKSNAIRPPSALGGWLHSVAFHTSLRARAMAKLRQHDCLEAVDQPTNSNPVEPTDPDWLRILDEEISKLPVKLRSAVALCELDGLSRTVAAARLGIAEGTVSSRLAAARKQLAKRLRARGVTLGIGGVAASFISSSAGAAPAVASVTNATVATLVERAIRTMFLIKLKMVSASVLAVAIIGVGLASVPSDAGERKREAPLVRRNAPVPKPHEGRILVWIGDQPLLFKPDGTKLASPEAIPDATMMVLLRNAKLSPDGKWIAFCGEQVPAAPTVTGKHFTNGGIRLLPLKGDVKPTTLERVHSNYWSWLDDPEKLFVMSGRDLNDDGTDRGESSSWVYDLKTGKRDVRTIPKNFAIMAVTPDGKRAVLQQTIQPTDKIHHQQIYLGTFDGEKPVALFEPSTILRSSPTFSPDGTRVLMYVEEWANMKPGKTGLFEGDLKSDRLVVLDVTMRKVTTIFDSKKNESPSEWKWSPNGKRIAYAHRLQTKGLDGPTTVTVSDADGKNAKDILEVESTMGHVGDTGLTLAWSPDGNRIAYLHQSAGPLDQFNHAVYAARAVVMDADGKNPTQIFEDKACSWVLMGFDWK